LTTLTTLDSKVAKFTATPKKMFINGEWVDALSGKRFETLNPATKIVITTVPEAGKEDVDRAVRAARTAFEKGPWPKVRPDER
jgi:acyl-CoA reductase-like NAD-dependent aldehyde dehydrogenase